MRRQLIFVISCKETSRMKIWSLNTVTTIVLPVLYDNFLAHLDFRGD